VIFLLLCFKFTELYKNLGWNRPLEGYSANSCSKSAVPRLLRVLSGNSENVQERRNETEAFCLMCTLGGFLSALFKVLGVLSRQNCSWLHL